MFCSLNEYITIIYIKSPRLYAAEGFETMSNYCKKMCVLKQLSSGFASDGKKVSGLLTAEKYGSRLTACFSLINFAPLTEGRYVAALSDTRGTLEFFELTAAGGTVKRESALNLEDGFCCLVCHISLRAAPAAFGKYGEEVYDVKKLCAALEQKERGADAAEEEPAAGAAKEADPPPYDDEIVATENYYEFPDADIKNLTVTENENEQCEYAAPDAAARTDREKEERAEETACGADAGENEDAVRLFKIENQGGEEPETHYYDSVKDELSELFEKYPAEENLQRAVENSKWVKIEFAPQKYYTVGLMYEKGKPRYICYGVPAESKNEPPNALKGFCSYLPLSLFDLRGKGYWMMYQDADTGRCVEIAST